MRLAKADPDKRKADLGHGIFSSTHFEAEFRREIEGTRQTDRQTDI
jgi:hypothetical protein